jgi:hypothetical protein
MPRRAAPSSLTGEGGANFEDLLAACMLLNLVSGRHPLEPPLGVVSRVHRQARDAGWLLDDLVVELLDSNGLQHVAAMSVKSDRQVTAGGFPKEFVHDAWALWLANGAPFHRDRDVFVLAVGDLGRDVHVAWSGLLKQSLAAQAQPRRLVQRLKTRGMASKLKRTLFQSLRCPADLDPDHRIPDELVAEFVRHVRVLHFDFLISPSKDLSEALSQSATVTRSGRVRDGQVLWKALVGFAAEQRPSGGSADLETILKLPNLPPLRAHPDYRGDWRRLRRVTEDATGKIRGTIGVALSLPRCELRKSIVECLSKNKTCVLLAQSGMGKSVLAKQVFQDISGKDGVWLDPFVWSERGLDVVRNQLQMEHDLAELIRLAPMQSGVVVFDGLDRLSNDELQIAAQVVAVAHRSARWKTLVTCTPTGWADIAHALACASVQVSQDAIVQVPPLMPGELREVARAIPQIAASIWRPELRPFLETPKILDWLAEGLPAFGAPVNMPALVDCLWNRWVRFGEDRYQRSQVLKQIASLEADQLCVGVGIGEITQGTGLLPSLEDDRVLDVQHERVRFCHDLLGDWARLYVLIENRHNASELIGKKHKLPRWHYAIQLFGQWLLCQGTTGLAEWKTLACPASSSEKVGAAQDLLLDSVVLSTDPSCACRQVWEVLIESDGTLLRRLLRRFLHVATIPDPLVEVFFDDSARVEARSLCRVPFWPLWTPMLPFLHEKAQECIQHASDLIAQISHLWLTKTPSSEERRQPFPGRVEAAHLAILSARERQALIAEQEWSRRDPDGEVPWAALLAAADVLPEEAASVALELVGRRPPSPQIVAREESAQRRRKEECERRLAAETPEQRKEREERFSKVPLGSISPEGEMLPPWQDGPTRQIEESFRKACLSPGALVPLFQHLPDVATEILLAACIEAPHRADPWGAPDSLENLETWTDYGTQPPMFNKGPFYYLLKKRPKEGIDALIRLVHFVTDRWEEWDRKCEKYYGGTDANEQRSVTVLLDDGPVEWKGNDRAFGWYRNRFGDAEVAVSGLMALEKWLYDLLDSGQNANEWLSYILSNAGSTAIAGVLCAMARKSPSLLAGPLRPLMSVPQFYEWERRLWMEEHGVPPWRVEMMSWTRFGEKMFNMAKQWHELPYRKSSFQDECVKQLLTVQDTQEWFKRVREVWREQLLSCSDQEGLEILIARFDPANYRARRNGDKILIEFHFPESLAARMEDGAKEAEVGMKVMYFPVKCRRILDGETTIEEKEVEAFWAEMLELASSVPEDIKTTMRAVDITCGGIAVLLRFHPRYILDSEEKLKWCAEQLESTVSNPPRMRDFDVPDAVGSHTWDCFWAEAVVMLLAEDPDDRHLRDWAGQAVMQFHYNATACALRTAWRERDRLNEDVWRLVNLSLLWAGTRHALSWARRLGAKNEAYNKWCDRSLDWFRDGKLPGDRLLDMARLNILFTRIADRQEIRARNQMQADEKGLIALEPGSGLAQLAMSRYSSSLRWPGLDTGVLAACMDLVVDACADKRFRRLQLDLMNALLGIVRWSLRSELSEKDDEDLRGTPSEFQRHVFDTIAGIMPHLDAEDHPEHLWQPILDLGPDAHYWVEAFLTSWLMYGWRSCSDRSRFFDLWGSMICYSGAHPHWQRTKHRRSYHLGRMWAELMGFGLGGRMLSESGENGPFLLKMAPLYERWARDWLVDAWSLRDFAGFCATAAGQALLPVAMGWVSGAAKEITGNRDFSEATSAVARMCGICWEIRRGDLTRNRALREAFLDILALLADQQRPEALQLRDEVLRSFAQG